MKKLKVSINNEKSIDEAIRKLEKYKEELRTKTEAFMSELADAGIQILDAYVGRISPIYRTGGLDAGGDDLSTSKGAIREEGDKWICEIFLNGSQSVFVEFGSGVTHNTSVGGSLHPKGGELGFTIGSYPGQTHADDPNGWYYRSKWSNEDKYGKKGKNVVHTYGTPTFAPLYNTSQDLIDVIYEVAKRTYG